MLLLLEFMYCVLSYQSKFCVDNCCVGYLCLGLNFCAFILVVMKKEPWIVFCSINFKLIIYIVLLTLVRSCCYQLCFNF